MTACPDREELAAWSFGLSLDPRTGEIARHVCDCPDCASTLEAIEAPADPLLEGVRHPVAPDTILEEPECFRLVTRLASIEQDLGPAGGAPGSGEVSLGSRLGPYEILAWIGGGGMGAVYRARHTHLDREVAVKVLPPDRLFNPQAVSRFRREMKSVGALDHPNIVQARDAGETGGTHYLVMELVEGLDLAKLVAQKGPLPVAEAAEIIRQAAEGLDHAYCKGLVHRDIKPSNIVLARDGRVKLLDLGLALLRGDRTTQDDLTGVGQVMGTVAYMAPEQATDPHAVDVRADLYSLGCTLFFLLAGRAPYNGPGRRTPIQQIMAHSQEPIPPIRATRPDVPEGLAAILERLLAKSPADRFATPAELSTALKPFCDPGRVETLSRLADGPPAAEPEETEVEPKVGEIPAARPSPAPVPIRRRPGVRAAIALALIPLAALLAFQIVVIVKDKEGKEIGRQVVPEGGSIEVDRAAVQPGPAVVPPPPSGETGPPLSPVAMVQSPARLPGVESWTIETRLIRAGAYQAAFDPSGRLLAVSAADGSVRLLDAASGRVVRVLVPAGEATWTESLPLAWQPGTGLLAVGEGDGTVRLLDAGSGRVVRVVRNNLKYTQYLSWSPDGRTLGLGGANGLRLWDVDSGLRDLALATCFRAYTAWAPDGLSLAIHDPGRRRGDHPGP